VFAAPLCFLSRPLPLLPVLTLLPHAAALSWGLRLEQVDILSIPHQREYAGESCRGSGRS